MISVMMEYGSECLGEKKLKFLPEGGLYGVLMAHVRRLYDGWYVVTAQDTKTGDVLDKQAFWQFRDVLRTYEMKRTKTEDMDSNEEDSSEAIRLYIHPNNTSDWMCWECGKTFSTGDHIYETEEPGDDSIYGMLCTRCKGKIMAIQVDEEHALKRLEGHGE